MGSRAVRLVLGLVLLVSFFPNLAEGAPHGPFNHADENWRVVETKYFRIYASDRNPNSVRHLVRIADDTFERLNQFYKVKPPDKIAVSIVGYTDFSNAFADSLRNRITIYATPADFHSRSRVPWLDNVFTHELSHILSLNRAAHWSRNIPVVLGTGLARGETTQGLARAPFYPRNLPHWFVEGVAQFDTRLLGRDSFDENRASFQRAGWEDGLFFPLGKLAFFGREKWYNTGFSFLLYLDERFGEGTTHRLFSAAGERHGFSFSSLFQDTLGVSLSELERDFRARVRRDYEQHRARVKRGRFDGLPLRLEGQRWSYRELAAEQRDFLRADYRSGPLLFDAGRLFYNRNGSIFSGKLDADRLLVTDEQPLGKGTALAANGTHGYFVLRQDGHSPTPVPSVYRPDFESPSLFLVEPGGHERLLLEDSHLLDFDVCARRRELAAVYNNGDGSLSLALYPLEHFGSGKVRVQAQRVSFPLPPQNLDEVRSPRYSPDCKRLFFSRRAGDDHDIYYWEFSTRRLVSFATEDSFELYPAPTDDGAYFVSARDGTMSVYYRSNDGRQTRRHSMPITGHHYPVVTPQGLVFARVHSTGFQTYLLPLGTAPTARLSQWRPKPDAQRWSPIEAWGFPSGPYEALAPRNLASPLIVPIVDVLYDHPDSTSAQVGLDLYLEDHLRTHSLRFNGFVGDRSSFWANYRNDMTPLTWQLRGGMTSVRSQYVFDSAQGESFDQVQTSSWSFLGTTLSSSINLFYEVGLDAETIRDTGTVVGARSWPFGFGAPRYARDQLAAFAVYDGLDRSNPVFRERVVNKRGYRTFDVRAALAVEEVHPLLEEFAPDLEAGRKPYARVDFNHHEYIELPDLMRGYFDHSLQIDVSLGYISRDIRFLPFFGGGRLRSLTTPELSNSVGFVGYSPYSLVGETLVNVGLSYRFPLARELSWAWGPFFLEDVYGQLFTSWGNIWGYDQDGSRQWPGRDRAPNGEHVVGDVGLDLRLNHFLQEVEANVGTTLRTAYRLVPFSQCADDDVRENPSCLGVNGKRGLMTYLMLGVGF